MGKSLLLPVSFHTCRNVPLDIQSIVLKLLFTGLGWVTLLSIDTNNNYRVFINCFIMNVLKYNQNDAVPTNIIINNRSHTDTTQNTSKQFINCHEFPERSLCCCSLVRVNIKLWLYWCVHAACRVWWSARRRYGDFVRTSEGAQRNGGATCVNFNIFCLLFKK